MPAFNGGSRSPLQGSGGVAFTGAEGTAVALSLAPGRWKLDAKGYANWSVGVADTYWCGMYLRSGSGAGPLLDAVVVSYVSAGGQIPFSLLAVVTFATATDVLLRGAPSHAGVGTQLLTGGVLVATPI